MPKLTLKQNPAGYTIFDDDDDILARPLVQFNVSNFLLIGKVVEIKAQGQNLQFPVELIPLIIKGLKTIHETPDC